MTETLTSLAVEDHGGGRRARRAAEREEDATPEADAEAPQYLPSSLSTPAAAGAPAPMAAPLAAASRSFEEIMAFAPTTPEPVQTESAAPQYLPVPAQQVPAPQAASAAYAAPATPVQPEANTQPSAPVPSAASAQQPVAYAPPAAAPQPVAAAQYAPVQSAQYVPEQPAAAQYAPAQPRYSPPEASAPPAAFAQPEAYAQTDSYSQNAAAAPVQGQYGAPVQQPVAVDYAAQQYAAAQPAAAHPAAPEQIVYPVAPTAPDVYAAPEVYQMPQSDQHSPPQFYSPTESYPQAAAPGGYAPSAPQPGFAPQPAAAYQAPQPSYQAPQQAQPQAPQPAAPLYTPPGYAPQEGYSVPAAYQPEQSALPLPPFYQPEPTVPHPAPSYGAPDGYSVPSAYQPEQPAAVAPPQAYQPTPAAVPYPVPVVYQEPNPAPTIQPNVAYQPTTAFAPQLAYTPEPFVEVPEGYVTEANPYEYKNPLTTSVIDTDSGPAEFDLQRDPSLNADVELDAALERVRVMGGSDLHITANSAPMIRLDGGLRALEGTSVWGVDKVSAALHSILTPEQRATFEHELELDFAYTLSANARFRVNIYQQRDNLGAAFRLIPTEIKSLKSLGVPESIADFATLARGLVLITGPTGSGKSTTLAGLIDLVNRTRADHIMTVEDPIEFLHQNHKSLVNQREVGHDTHSFGQALKHVLRQDPDVILVGELRDLETISVALTAAETGHLVFATLHTSDAPQTIDRIIDVYPSHQQSQVRSQLAATLQGVVCQTLVKKATGKGRVVATEVLVRTGAVANLIREGKTFQIHSAMQAGRDLGMHTLDQHLADLVNTGQITIEAAREKAHDLDVLARLVTGSRSASPDGGSMGDGGDYSSGYAGGQN